MKRVILSVLFVLLLSFAFVYAENETNQTGNNSTTNSTNSTNLTCDDDDDCMENYECEDNVCVLEDEDEDDDTNMTIVCSESDSGLDYYNKGETKVKYDGNSSSLISFNDKCENSTHLKEYSCSGNYTQNGSAALQVPSVLYFCEYGCYEGACKKQNSTNSTNMTCTEDDDCSSGYDCKENKCVLDDDDEADDIVKDNLGAKVRILQLQKAIYKMILYSEAVVEVIDEKNNGTNSTNQTQTLKSIIEEMKVLLDKAEDMSADNVTNNTVKDFVAIKEDAISLRKEFKEEAKKYLTAEDKKKIREKFNEIDKEKLKDYREKIKEQIKMYNSNRIKKLSELAGLDDFSERVRKGDIDSSEAVRALKKAYLEMSEEDRERVRKIIMESIKEEDSKYSKIVSKAREESLKEISKRDKERIKMIKERMEKDG